MSFGAAVSGPYELEQKFGSIMPAVQCGARVLRTVLCKGRLLLAGVSKSVLVFAAA